MPKLTPDKREEVIRRRGNISDGDGKKHPITNLEIHHKDRNTDNNAPKNLRVLTKNEHQVLHGKGRTKR
ncbi:MAG: HNH endonuclease [Chloroflexi bacterium]|nr:HNH endonuclease [Chloroflexota bacterium]